MVDEIKYHIKIFNNCEDARSSWIKFQKNSFNYIFQTYEWASNWVLTIGKHELHSIKIVEVKINNKTIMLLPFIIKKIYSVKVLCWLGGDYCCGLFCKDFSQKISNKLFLRIWNEIKSELGFIDLIYLSMQPNFIGRLFNPFVNYLDSYPYHAKSYQIDVGNGWEIYKETLKKKLVKDSERQEKRLATFGRLNFTIAKRSDDYSGLTNNMIDQKAKQYIRTKTKNIFENKDYRNFYLRLSHYSVKNEFVHLSSLNINSENIAIHWGLLDKKNSILFYLMPSHDNIKWSKYSPGRLLMIELLKWCEQNKIKILDMTSGNELYKLVWSNKNMTIHNFLDSITFKGLLLKRLLMIRHNFKRRKFNE